MIYLIGGAPRAGKSILTQQFAAKQRIGWISTDLLMELLRVNNKPGIKSEWNGTPEAIVAAADWFFPFLERFVWGASSLAEDYAIEGVDFLPAQVAQLASRYQIRCVFLGCSQMTLEKFERFPGRSPGYNGLPETLRRQIVHDVPLWSEFILEEAARFDFACVDTAHDFSQRMLEAEAALLGKS